MDSWITHCKGHFDLENLDLQGNEGSFKDTVFCFISVTNSLYFISLASYELFLFLLYVHLIWSFQPDVLEGVLQLATSTLLRLILHSRHQLWLRTDFTWIVLLAASAFQPLTVAMVGNLLKGLLILLQDWFALSSRVDCIL